MRRLTFSTERSPSRRAGGLHRLAQLAASGCGVAQIGQSITHGRALR